jgi:F-type H+-transporting ATPase subunit gamma
VIGGARGLCGGYNVALLRHAQEFLDSQEKPTEIITVGIKARQYFAHSAHLGQTMETPDDVHRLLQAREIARVLREMFLKGEVGEVHVVYTRFYSAIRQVPTVRQLLPIAPAEEKGTGNGSSGVKSFLYEPPAEELLGSLLPRAIDAAVYEMLLNAAASEEGARMAAMTAATDNAQELMVSLTRELNRARQTQITNEILEVVAGADALNE